MVEAVSIGLGDRVVHQLQGCAAADDALFGPAVENNGKELSRALQAGKLAVVSRVDAAVDAVARGGEHRENIADHIELLGTRLAAGHIQLELLRFQRIKLFVYETLLGQKLFKGELTVTL